MTEEMEREIAKQVKEALANVKLKPKKTRKRKHISLPDILSDAQVKDFLNTFNQKTKTGYRNYCLFLTLFHTGVRISEALHMTYEAIRKVETESGETAYFFRLLAKDSKTSISKDIPIKETLYKHYLELSRLYGHRQSGYIFTPVSRNSKTKKFSYLQSRYVRAVAAEKGVEAGIPFPFHPHLTRHYFGSTIYRKSNDLFLVKSALYHKNIASSEIYTHISPEAVRKASELIDF
jgi:integrase/recombinase XerD